MASKDFKHQAQMTEDSKDSKDSAHLPMLLKVDSEDENKVSRQDSDEWNLTMRLYKDCRIRIYKPLILLKIVLFLWYGGAAFAMPFMILYLKQLGITLSEIATGFVLAPIMQFLTTFCSGVLADKFGRSKPILFVNLILIMMVVCGIILVPKLNTTPCLSHPIHLECNPLVEFDTLMTRRRCDIVKDTIEVKSCNVHCPKNITQQKNSHRNPYELFPGTEELRNFSLSVRVTETYSDTETCYYNISSMSHENETYFWCNIPQKLHCRVSCMIASGEMCSNESTGRDGYMVITLVLFVSFLATISNMYRLFDVTSMSLITEHGSDYGKQRFFSISGILVLSPIGGYIVSVSTPQGAEAKFVLALYFFLGITSVLLVLVYFLNVRITPPAKKMWKKAFVLLLNPDILAFVPVLLVLGAAFSITKNLIFWYLEEMKAPSSLVGLIPAVGSLYGMPFLPTSQWWMDKIGANRLFVIGLLGYTINTIGYSFLTNPWMSLVLEATNIVTYHLLWVAVILHVHELAPEGLTATVIATAGSIHYQFGRAAGNLLGGLIMDAFDGPTAFRVMGIICLITAVLYELYIYLRQSCCAKKSTHMGVVIENGKTTETYASWKDNDD